MANRRSENIFKKVLLFVFGGAILVFGLALILEWWPYVGIVFKGVAGIMVALVGLLILAFVRG